MKLKGKDENWTEIGTREKGKVVWNTESVTTRKVEMKVKRRYLSRRLA